MIIIFENVKITGGGIQPDKKFSLTCMHTSALFTQLLTPFAFYTVAISMGGGGAAK